VTPSACWSCGQAPESLHFCRHCQSVQPPAGDYFEYLGLPRKLQVQPGEIEKNFYDLSRRLHPDMFFQRSERERLLAELASARLNDAYRTLKDRISRTEYLLLLHGMKPEYKSSSELLEKIFELKVAIDQARAGDDSARSRLRVVRKTFHDTLGEAEEALDASFAQWDDTGDEQALTKIAELLTVRKFHLNLLEELEAALA
jgi:molecular chaperone HscB